MHPITGPTGIGSVLTRWRSLALLGVVSALAFVLAFGVSSPGVGVSSAAVAVPSCFDQPANIVGNGVINGGAWSAPVLLDT